jgi:hypothetical protein
MEPSKTKDVNPLFCHSFPEWQGVNHAREAQKLSGKSLRGHSYLSPDIEEESFAAREALLSSDLGKELGLRGLKNRDLETLSLRFEEMCRRREVTLPACPEERGKIYGLLAHQLLYDADLLGYPPSKLIPVTLTSTKRPSHFEFDERFEAFKDSPWIFRYAAVNHPSDPEGFLVSVIDNISKLSSDKRFEAFKDSPGIFLRAAIGNPSDPEGFLVSVIDNISKLSSDKRFEAFKDSPGIFLRAAVHNPSDPEEFLVSVIDNISKLSSDKRFEAFKDSPGIFRHAAVHNPSDPEGFLVSVIDNISKLSSDKRFEAFKDSPWIFLRAAVTNPSDPEGFLVSVIDNISKLSRE